MKGRAAAKAPRYARSLPAGLRPRYPTTVRTHPCTRLATHRYIIVNTQYRSNPMNKIKDIEIIWLDVPFHDVPNRNMARQNNGWHISEICRVTADNGMVGYGETLPNYTWGKVTQASIDRAKGANPFDLMW